MKNTLKYCLLQDRKLVYLFKMQNKLLSLLFFAPLLVCTQNANYVNNGNFERTVNNCIGPLFPLSTASSWLSIDSISYGGEYISVCTNKVPLNANTFQFPKSGTALIITTMYYYPGSRGYLKNRLKSNLQPGKTYCVKFHINIANTSTYGMDGFGAYFGDNSIDTITKCTVPLTYINPQVKNPLGNVITDTLNWVPISGTFVATGNEKYMLIGNFLADNAVSTVSLNPQHLPDKFTDVCIDDVSCMDIDLPAWAGRDTSCITGTTVYIGRTRDVGIDEACIWYKLPDIANPIATGVAGLTVSPMQTSTYVVKQQLWCSGVKYDTVVVFKDGVGLDKWKILNEELNIYPVPAKDYLNIEIKNEKLLQEIKRIAIYNSLGELVLAKALQSSEKQLKLGTEDLANGVYLISFIGSNNETINKKLLISK